MIQKLREIEHKQIEENAEKCENLVLNLHRKMEEILQNNADKEEK